VLGKHSSNSKIFFCSTHHLRLGSERGRPFLGAALLIALLLVLPVSLDRFRVCLPVLSLIIRVLFPPSFLAVANQLRIYRVGCDLLTVILGASSPLAACRAANTLIGTVLRSWKGLLAIAAATGRQAESPPRSRMTSSGDPMSYSEEI
jgi:hypothetical protein